MTTAPTCGFNGMYMGNLYPLSVNTTMGTYRFRDPVCEGCTNNGMYIGNLYPYRVNLGFKESVAIAPTCGYYVVGCTWVIFTPEVLVQPWEPMGSVFIFVRERDGYRPGFVSKISYLMWCDG